MAIATGHCSAWATVAVTRSRSSPAIAPETRVSGVARGAVVSAPRAGADCRLPQPRVRAACWTRTRTERPGPSHHAGVGVAVDRTPQPPGHPAGIPERRDVGRVHLVAVFGRVADLHVLLGHPQRDEQADQLQQHERAERRPDDHEQAREQLPLDQVEAAVDRRRRRRRCSASCPRRGRRSCSDRRTRP